MADSKVKLLTAKWIAKLNAGKSVIKTVDDELYSPEILDAYAADPVMREDFFPYAGVFAAGMERPATMDVNTAKDSSVPIVVSIWLVRKSNLATEMEAVIKEARDIIELNPQWDGLAYNTFDLIVNRDIPWKGELQTAIIANVEVSARVQYRYVKGAS